MREICTRGLPVPRGLDPMLDRILRGLLVMDDRRRWRRREVEACLAAATIEPPPARAEGAPAPAAPLRDAAEPGAGGRDAAEPGTGGRPAGGGTTAPFRCLGSEFRSPRELAERFNLDAMGWEAGTAYVARGSVAAWLRCLGRRADADQVECEARGGPHERLFTFIRMFAPGSPPAFHGVILTLDNILTLLKSRDDPREGRPDVLDEILCGNLKRFPQISSFYGRPMEEAVELALTSGHTTAETLTCALAALHDPEPFIWGASGPPEGIKAAAFVLEAGCPLLDKGWWARNAPPGLPFPPRLLNGPLDSPKTYAMGAREAQKMAASWKRTSGEQSGEQSGEPAVNGEPPPGTGPSRESGNGIDGAEGARGNGAGGVRGDGAEGARGDGAEGARGDGAAAAAETGSPQAGTPAPAPARPEGADASPRPPAGIWRTPGILSGSPPGAGDWLESVPFGIHARPGPGTSPPSPPQAARREETAPPLLGEILKRENPAILFELASNSGISKVHMYLTRMIDQMPDMIGRSDQENEYGTEIAVDGVYWISRFWSNRFFRPAGAGSSQAPDAGDAGPPILELRGTGAGGPGNWQGFTVKGFWKAFDGYLSLVFVLKGGIVSYSEVFTKIYYIADQSG
jgi:hypothetical protein